MAFDIGSVLGNLGSIIPSQNDLANQIVTGAAASVVLAGLKSDAGQNAVDPLHLFHKDGSSTVVGGKTISSAAFAALDSAGKAQVLAAGYVIAG